MTGKKKSTTGERPLPYIKWYEGDHRASERVQAMNWQVEGVYRRLIMECFLKGYIPDDALRLSKICRCPPGFMVRAWGQIRDMFITVDGLDGELLTHDRVEAARTEQDRIRAARAVAGRVGGINKANASNSQHLPYSREEKKRAGASEAFASPDGAQMLLCSECGSDGVRFKAGIHKPSCSLRDVHPPRGGDPVALSDEAAR